ncbi:MAG: glycosyltransferase [Planctomycetes bacterium]|nr:glycosyltransferase [Planctomycetota bacterium]
MNEIAAKIDDAAMTASPAPTRLRGRVWRFALRAFVLSYLAALAVARGIGCLLPKRKPTHGHRILLTGTFYSANWIAAHVGPLAAARNVERVYVATTFPIPPIDKVVPIYPAPLMRKLIGDVPARMLTFCWAALAKRPHWVGGFHLLLNGMLAILIAPLVRARSLYFSVGGPMEIWGGGFKAENRLFAKLPAPDPFLERRMLAIIRRADRVATMGTRAIRFYRDNGVCCPIAVMAGGMDTTHLCPTDATAEFDVILVGRLAPVKRIDVFLEAINLARRSIPSVRAVVVGDGELRAELERQAAELGLTNHVKFAGHQSDVASWLKRAKVFVLSSDTEGLALSLIEAMLCGLTPVVSNVGDLGDLVNDGKNGFLVPRRDARAFAARIVELLTNDGRRRQFSAAAREAALTFDVHAAGKRWVGWLNS